MSGQGKESISVDLELVDGYRYTIILRLLYLSAPNLIIVYNLKIQTPILIISSPAHDEIFITIKILFFKSLILYKYIRNLSICILKFKIIFDYNFLFFG